MHDRSASPIDPLAESTASGVPDGGLAFFRNGDGLVLDFMAACCVKDRYGRVETQALFRVYFAWCVVRDCRALPFRVWQRAVREAGFTIYKSGRSQVTGVKMQPADVLAGIGIDSAVMAMAPGLR